MARDNIYPIGDQSFPSIREGGYVYVDKTRYIELLLDKTKYFFLGRPRRFGKSLFLSTLKCFFEGRRELFKGLYADTMDWDCFEVTRGFMNYLLPYYANLNTEDSAFVVSEFVREFREGKVDGFMTRLQRMFAKTTYKLKIENENNLQNALYILMTLVGLYVQAELCTSDGCIDLFVAANKFYYIIELKVDSTPEEALRQIEEKNYALPFTLDGRQIIKIGVNFSTDSRTITGWQTAQ